MQRTWFLSEFVTAEGGGLLPVAASYGMRWRCPRWPEPSNDGYALVEMWCTATQIEAAKQDPRICVCGVMSDPRPAPAALVTAYAGHGATTGMSLAAVVSMMADLDPTFALDSL